MWVCEQVKTVQEPSAWAYDVWWLYSQVCQSLCQRVIDKKFSQEGRPIFLYNLKASRPISWNCVNCQESTDMKRVCRPIVLSHIGSLKQGVTCRADHGQTSNGRLITTKRLKCTVSVPSTRQDITMYPWQRKQHWYQHNTSNIMFTLATFGWHHHDLFIWFFLAWLPWL